MRIIKDTETRKQEILSGALSVFSRKGYDKTSITDIAKEVGISQGLCYRYYKSKEEIYDEALEEYANFIVQKKIESYKSSSQNNLKQNVIELSGIFSNYLNIEKENGDLYTLFHSDGNEKMHDQLILKVGQNLVPFIAQVLKDAKSKGEIIISNPETTAYFLVFGQIGILMNKDINEEERSKNIQECIIKLLGL